MTLTIEDEILKRQITEHRLIVGKTIAAVWADHGTSVGIRFDDGTYALLIAKQRRFDDDPVIYWGDRPGPWHLHEMGVITEEQGRELERRANERRADEQMESKRRQYEQLKAEFEGKTDAPKGG